MGKSSTKTRDFVAFYLNGKRTEVRGDLAFLPLSSFLRYHHSLPGTKVVCAEGDCGACTVLITYPGRFKILGPAATKSPFISMNSCIAPTYLLDGASIVTVEGLANEGELTPVQKQMVSCQGSQCGYCTPGFVMALTGMFERSAVSKDPITSARIKNYTTGNLCRCTGYAPIVTAACEVDPKSMPRLAPRYLTPTIQRELTALTRTGFTIETATKKVFAPTDRKEVSKLLLKHKTIRIISSATDLGVRHNKEHIDLDLILSLQHLGELFALKESAHTVEVGAKVDLERLRRNTAKSLPDFSRFLNLFASPQIRNVATLASNIANGSPIADTVPYLFVAEAKLEIQGPRTKRLLPITKFYSGYKKMDLKPGEWISRILIPKPKGARVFLYKVSQRRDLDISTVNAGFYFKRDAKKGLTELRISYGGVGPTALRLPKTEALARKTDLTTNLGEIIKTLQTEITPMGDLRGSEAFRRKVSANLFKKFVLESGLDGPLAE